MVATNIPIQLTSFIGRQRDLADVTHLVTLARCVTLTGAGGAGKTRLALQAARQVSHVFADGAWLVDLVPLRDPALLPHLVAQTLDLRTSTNQPVLEQLQFWLRTRHLLLVLDNCEHLIEACARLAGQLLTQTADLHVLATSREPLGVPGEMLYPLSGLSQPDPRTDPRAVPRTTPDPASLLAYDAVRLFVERVRAVVPNFSLNNENASVVTEICHRLDALPLAIELASARANVLTVNDIAERLSTRKDGGRFDGDRSGDPLSLLSAGRRSDYDPRHQTLHAAIDWSYTLLTSEEQALLRRMAVFSAGCTLDMVEQVCGESHESASHTLERLSSLVDKSLVVADTQGKAQARYRLLETIREYALEKLHQSGETARLRDRHLALFLARAEEASSRLFDAYQQLWLNWFSGELDNLRAALAWSLESGQIEAGLRMISAMVRFWEIRGFVPEMMAWFDRLLPQSGEQVALPVRAYAYTMASHGYMFLGNAEKATVYAERAMSCAEAQEEGSDLAVLNALGALSSGAEAAGDNQTAYAIAERAIELLDRTPGVPPFIAGMTYLGGANIAVEAGQYDRAREMLAMALRLAREAGDAFREAHAFTRLGKMAWYEGKLDEAVFQYEKGLALLHQLDARHDEAGMLRELGRVHLLRGDRSRARDLFLESFHLHLAEQNRSGLAECLVGFAALALERGQAGPAACLLGAAESIGGPGWEASVWPARPMPYADYLAQARAVLSETAFQNELSTGSAMQIEEVLDYIQRLRLGSAPAPHPQFADLTGREIEVAWLIGEGRSNREIAGVLTISTRTVEKHVANILSKLGLTSRTQIVRWAMEHRLEQAAPPEK